MKKVKGFGKEYFSFASILAHSIANKIAVSNLISKIFYRSFFYIIKVGYRYNIPIFYKILTKQKLTTKDYYAY